ncbi:MAG: Amylopullulanase [Verrucomicrobiales bacterium]|nr:Amylopullulanase [Verrucomicrobiales bacterium]
MVACLFLLARALPAVEVPGLYGIHDHDPDPSEYLNHIKPVSGGGWITATVAVGHSATNTAGVNFSTFANAGHTVICRINNGYFPDGTIPVPAEYDNFARRCSNFVANSTGCNIWVIGNELNINAEWPYNGTKFAYVSPQDYASCFRKAYNAIKAIRPNDKVMPAALAPWAGPYGAGTLNGQPADGLSLSWVQYMNQMLTAISASGGIDGVTLHINSRGYTTNAIHSTQQVSAGGQQLYFSFYVYKDWVDFGIPSNLWNLPLYATECNGYYFWKGGHQENPSAHYEAGWMQEIYAEINRYNQSAVSLGKPIFRCVNMYRWCGSCDGWNIDGASNPYKAQILSDLDGAVAQNYRWPNRGGPPFPLLSAGASWKYLDDGSNQGNAWRGTNFNDAGWGSGAAPLGYGDPETTYIRSNRTDGSRITTTYFRRNLAVTNASFIGSLIFRLRRDDGAVVYLNGIEKFRSNMPTDTAVLYDTPASSTVGGADETNYFSQVLGPEGLVSGTNWLAVEVHQVNNTSTDVSFDLDLLAVSNQPPSISILSPANATTWGAPTNLIITAVATDPENGLSSVNLYADGTFLARNTNTLTSFTWTNAPEGSHSLVAVAMDNRGLSVTSAPVTILLRPVLLRSGSVWKYRDTGADLGAAWRLGGYDDTAWATGPAQLGYGDADEATVVSYGPVDTNKYITTYFRRAFAFSTTDGYTNLLFRLVRDDGAAVYVNGQEAFRTNLPTGTINFGTLALSAIGGADETNFVEAIVSVGLVVNGTNVVAVEMHQNSPNSSDLSFDLEVLGLRAPPPARLAVRSASDAQIELSWGGSAWNYRLEGAANLGAAWSPVIGTASVLNGQYSLVLPTASPMKFYRLAK